MDQHKVETLAIRVVADQAGAFNMALGYVGEKLGLYRMLRVSGPVTPDELAGRTGLNSRYVGEWLRAMAASEYLTFDEATGRYSMSEEQVFVLADERSPMFAGGAFQFTTPSTMKVRRVVEAFRNEASTPFAEVGGDEGAGTGRFRRAGYYQARFGRWIDAVCGLRERLERGIRIAEVGCGSGDSTIHMARTFPNSHVTGIDGRAAGFENAARSARDQGVENVQFISGDAQALGEESSFGLICTFNCMHSMVDPESALGSIRRALSRQGVFLWSEPKAAHEAIGDRGLFDAASPLRRVALSLTHAGAGLASVISEEAALKMAIGSGFTRFERLVVDDLHHQFWSVRK